MLSIPQNADQPYVFTVPDTSSTAVGQRSRRYPARPGCPLCSILVNLEDSSSASSASHQSLTPAAAASSETNPSPASPLTQPLSPAFPSPAGPLLPPSSASHISTSRIRPSDSDGDGRILVIDDDELTGWIASRSERLASGGRHVVIVFKRHVEDVYDFVSDERAFPTPATRNYLRTPTRC